MLKHNTDKNKSGYVLVITRITILFVSLIGELLLQVAYFDYIYTNFYIKHRQSYLIARADAKLLRNGLKIKIMMFLF